MLQFCAVCMPMLSCTGLSLTLYKVLVLQLCSGLLALSRTPEHPLIRTKIHKADVEG